MTNNPYVIKNSEYQSSGLGKIVNGGAHNKLLPSLKKTNFMIRSKMNNSTAN